MQQYSSVLNIVQGLLHPPGTFNSFRHNPLRSPVQSVLVHSWVVGLKAIGTLNPLTTEMSKKSRFWYRFKVTSTGVIGGVP